MIRNAMLLHLTRTAAAAVRRGHPWVYREGIAPRVRLRSGTVVDVADPGGAFLGRGLWDEGSPIAVRVYQHSRERPLDESAFVARVQHAIRLREALFASRDDTDTYRLCNGEGDRLPGLVIDRYATTAIVRLDGGLLEPWLE